MIDEVRIVLEADPRIAFRILFGSDARGTMHLTSADAAY